MVGQGQTSLKNSDLTPFIDEKIEVQIKHTCERWQIPDQNRGFLTTTPRVPNGPVSCAHWFPLLSSIVTSLRIRATS